MDWALRNNVSQVTSEFVMQVFDQSPKISIVKARIRALANHDIKALMEFQDLPLNQLQDYWLKDMPGSHQKKSRPGSLTVTQYPAVRTDDQEDAHAAAEKKQLMSGLKSLTEATGQARSARQAGRRSKKDVE
jgi:hypothetical protein